jgi:hypothetical protein
MSADSGCPHPESALVDLSPSPTSPVWCRICGSVCARGVWIAPRSLVLPGWTCRQCGGFNGALKELLTDCRGCGAPLLLDPTKRTGTEET